MKAAGSTPPVSASSILAAGAASSHGRTLALSSPQPEPTSPCPQSPQKPPLERRGDVNGYHDGGEIEKCAAVEKKQRASQRHLEEEGGGQNVERDVEQSDNHRRGQFAEYYLAGAERGHHQLVQRAKLALAGDRQGGDDKSDDQRYAGDKI